MLQQRDEHVTDAGRYCSTPDTPFIIALPEPNLDLSQSDEWCLVRIEDGWQEIRFHDYSELYDVPNLYEYLFYEILQCQSPTVIRELLLKQVSQDGRRPESLRMLDLGAGNGMVGEALAEKGVETIVGVDILEAATRAAERDRPGIYTDYVVADMTDLQPEVHDRLRDYRLNGLCCVAALGFGDVPVRVFIEAFNLIEPGGDIAFNIKEEFLENQIDSDFAELIHTMIDRGDLEIRTRERYVHRLSTGGKPLHYVALAGTKHGDTTIEA